MEFFLAIKAEWNILNPLIFPVEENEKLMSHPISTPHPCHETGVNFSSARWILKESWSREFPRSQDLILKAWNYEGSKVEVEFWLITENFRPWQSLKRK